MLEDKLGREQRIRLEAIAQANMLGQTAGATRRALVTGVDPVDELLAAADRIARYVERGAQ